MVKSPMISVIMAVHNGEKYLKGAIESILRQTFTDFEFIIVDDGSTDNSLRIIKAYDNISVIENDVRIGLTKSLNKALLMAQGEYVARQDADDLSLPCRFEEQIKFLEKHPAVVLLGTSIYIIDEKGNIIGEQTVRSKPTRSLLLKDNEFVHGSVIFKRSVVSKLGGYNELYKYAQDYELWLRMSKYFDVMNLENPLYCLRIRKSGIGLSNRREQFLFQVLARKIAMHELRCDIFLMNLIDQQGVRCIYKYLNRWERLLFYKASIGVSFTGLLYQNRVGAMLFDLYHTSRASLRTLGI